MNRESQWTVGPFQRCAPPGPHSTCDEQLKAENAKRGRALGRGVTESSRRERRVRIAVGSSALLVGLNLNTVSIAFADMRANSFEGESLAALGWVLSIYTIFFGALLVPAGRAE